jgi:myxalamid-type polyketide synthase MxaE and MxaD
VEALIDTGHSRFVELSPHPTLVPAVAEAVRTVGRHGVVVPSMRREADEGVVLRSGLGALYADGFAVDWRRLYPDASAPVELPVYPWQRERFWLDVPTGGAPTRRGRRDDPWLGWPVPLAGDGRVWENDLDGAVAPELFEHRIGGLPSVPAAGLVELVRRAASLSGSMRLSGVRFERRLDLDDDSPTTVQVTVAPDGHAHVHRRDGEGWTRHLTATVARGSAAPTAGAMPTAGPAGAIDDVYEMFAAAGVRLGPALRTLVTVQPSGGAMEAEVVAPSGGTGLFTALDAGLQLAAVAALRDGGSLFVPVAADVVWLASGPSAARCTAWLEPAPEPERAASRRASVRAYDATGEPVVAIDGLVLQRVGAVTPVDDWFYEIAWPPAPDATSTATAPRTWIVVGDERGYGAAVATELASSGAHVVTVAAGDLPALEAALDASGGPVHVALFHGLDLSDDRPATADPAHAWAGACGVVLDTVRLLAARRTDASVRVVTRGAHRVEPTDAVACGQATLWGLGRAIAEEQPHVWGGLVDIGPALGPGESAGPLAAELAGGTGPEVALRGGGRRVPRLVRRPPAASSALRLEPDRTYLVTGGFGAIGEQVAHWLVTEGARRVVLVGRTGLPSRTDWGGLDPESPAGRRVAVVRALEGAGAAIHPVVLDVGDGDAVDAFAAQFRAEGWPAIGGVFHTAAVFGGDLVDRLTTAGVETELRPKALGAWNLSRAFPDVDLFVLFSSIGALLPSAGQAAYAAANAFLDALAEQRAASGRVALSVNWGFWEGSGRDVSFKEAARAMTEAQGMGSFRPDQGLDALQRLHTGGAHRAVFVPVDWTAFATARPAGPPSLVTDLVAGASAGAALAGESVASTLSDDLLAAAPADRRAVAEAVVRSLVGSVMKLPEDRIDPDQPFGTLGLDSLTAIELRNRVEAVVGQKLSSTMAWNYPTVKELGAYVLSLVAPDAPQEIEPVAERRPPVDASVAELSEDDALLALMGRSE